MGSGAAITAVRVGASLGVTAAVGVPADALNVAEGDGCIFIIVAVVVGSCDGVIKLCVRVGGSRIEAVGVGAAAGNSVEVHGAAWHSEEDEDEFAADTVNCGGFSGGFAPRTASLVPEHVALLTLAPHHVMNTRAVVSKMPTTPRAAQKSPSPETVDSPVALTAMCSAPFPMRECASPRSVTPPAATALSPLEASDTNTLELCMRINAKVVLSLIETLA